MYKCFDAVFVRTPLNSLQHVIDKPQISSLIFQEGLYLASKEFWYELKKNGPDAKGSKINDTLLKYWIRSCMRSTPFATFAGFHLATLGDVTKMLLNESSKHKRNVRLDMDCIAEIICGLEKIPVIKNQLLYFVNNSVYEVANGYRYIGYSLQNGKRAYYLNSFEKNEPITFVLSISKKGATINELSTLLQQMADVSFEEANIYIEKLIDSQLLISDLEPCITGFDPLSHLIKQLQKLNGIANFILDLKKIQSLIQDIEEGVVSFENTEMHIRNILPYVKFPKNIFQVDLTLSVQNMEIRKELIENIVTQISELFVFARQFSNPDMQNFISNFQKKYEEAEVPLNVALDLDLGIGYAGAQNLADWGSEFVDDILFVGNKKNPNATMDYIRNFSLVKYDQYLKKKMSHIEINHNEINMFSGMAQRHVLPRSLSIMGSLYKKDNLIDDENYIFSLQGFSGPSSSNLLARFALGECEIFDFIKSLINSEEEENEDVIYAEIVHLPKSRTGNVLLRPIMRKYEIPYIGKSGMPLPNQITVDDIVIKVRNNQIILHSITHNKRIIPRLTSAHNFSAKSLPIYKFLCDLQYMGKSFPSIWDWGNLDLLDYLPRVVYKNILIKKARWRVRDLEFKNLPTNSSALISFFTQYRKIREMPRQVIYKSNDNELLIDFEDTNHINIFLQYVHKYSSIILEEFLFTHDNSIITDIKGLPFTNEIIIPIASTIKSDIPYSRKEGDINIKRTFAPGSEWLYFKIYCSYKSAENILRHVILPFVTKEIRLDNLKKFFFIRYNDSFPHIRLRFYNLDTNKQQYIQNELLNILKPFVDSNLIDKIVIDTYQRELERYNSYLIEYAETIFSFDSLAILNFLNSQKNGVTNKQRLFFALRGIDAFLNNFNIDTAGKSNLLKMMQNASFHEFGGSLTLQKMLNNKYRIYQNDIFSSFNLEWDFINGFSDHYEIIKCRSEEISNTCNSIIIICQQNNIDLNSFLRSCIHMSINRLFIGQQRKYELLIYHFLEKYYRSALTIEKSKSIS